jgi:hypothetical protein
VNSLVFWVLLLTTRMRCTTSSVTTSGSACPHAARSAWALPLVLGLTVATVRRRSVWYGIAAAGTAVVFSGLIPMPWPGHPLSAGRLMKGDLYVLSGLGMLAGVALTLARECRVLDEGTGASQTSPSQRLTVSMRSPLMRPSAGAIWLPRRIHGLNICHPLSSSLV